MQASSKRGSQQHARQHASKPGIPGSKLDSKPGSELESKRSGKLGSKPPSNPASKLGNNPNM